MTDQRILIDTGAIYAFVARTDAHHEAAKEFVGSWLDHRGRFLLLNVVFAETMTLFKARLGSRITLQVGSELRRNPALCLDSFGDGWRAGYLGDVPTLR